MGRLLDGQSPEKTQLHDPALPLVARGKLLQHIVELDQFQGGALRQAHHVFERGQNLGPAALLPAASPRVIDQNVPNEPGGEAKELRPAFPVPAGLPDHA